MEQKYICVDNGELMFNSSAHGTLNEQNISEANAELIERAVGCRREAEHYIDKDVKVDKVSACIAIGIGGIFTIVSTIWTIVLDWGFFMLIVLSGILLLFGLAVLLFCIKKQKQNAHIRDCGDLFFAQIEKAPLRLFGTKLKCACIIDGQPRLLVRGISSATYTALQKKMDIIIAYDKSTEAFLPIRLFVNADSSEQ
ncbi:MAG: hypothetical protein K2O04_01475 [Clostridiales bacterium]|nr:hypothetical protein [Clostridiales bacterium]